MFFLLATIALSTALIIAFKIFERLGIDVPTAIVINYWTCVLCGILANGGFPVSESSMQSGWAVPAMLLGALFYALFNLIGWCTVRAGVAATSVANKLSMVIPVSMSVWLYAEELGAGKIAGILLALPAVYLSTRGQAASRPDQASKPASGLAVFGLVVVFVGSGIADTVVKWTETKHLTNPADHPAYLVHVFLAAAVLGTCTLVVRAIHAGRRSATATPKKVRSVNSRAVLGGIMLGIPNYFSIFTLIRLLQQKDFLQSSAAIPVVNIGVVVFSTLGAVLLFREQLGRTKLAGLALALAALLLIALYDRNA